MSTGFTLERSVFADSRLNFSGNLGYGVGMPAAALRGSYSHRLSNGSEPTLALTMRRFAAADPNLHNAALQALALSASDDFSVGDVGIQIWQRASDHPVHGPRDRLPPPWLRRSAPVA